MSRLRWILAASLLSSLSGCAWDASDVAPGKQGPLVLDAARTTVDRAKAGLGKLAPHEQPELPRWDWATLIPKEVPRAERIMVDVDPKTGIAILPELGQSREIQLASYDSEAVPSRIVHAAGKPVSSFADLEAVAVRAKQDNEFVQVTFRMETGTAGPIGKIVDASPENLTALSQVAAPKHRMIRINENGNPWILLRKDGLRIKLMGRAERETGLLQLVFEQSLCWGYETVAIDEVSVTCDGTPMRCLSVAETLQALYGEPAPLDPEPGSDSFSYAAVSERDDYFVPVNYKALFERYSNAVRHSTQPTPVPAFACVAGESYPGPAILGDARALAAFLMQRRVLQAGEKPAVHWLVFSSDRLKEGGDIIVQANCAGEEFTLKFAASPR